VTLPSDWLPEATPDEEKVARFLCQLRYLDPDKIIKAYVAVLITEGQKKDYGNTRDMARVPTWRALWVEARMLLEIHRFIGSSHALRTAPNPEEELDPSYGAGTYLEFYLPGRDGSARVRAEDTYADRLANDGEEEPESLAGFVDDAGESWPDYARIRPDKNDGRDPRPPRHEPFVLPDFSPRVSAERRTTDPSDSLDVASASDERGEDLPE